MTKLFSYVEPVPRGNGTEYGTEYGEMVPNTDWVIVSARVFNSPRERVFQAFADPNHLAQWWGPKGFTNTFHEFDFKPGGMWRFVMHGSAGADYLNESVFVEIVKPERIVFEHLKTLHWFQMTMTFADVAGEPGLPAGQAGKTKLTWHMLFDSAVECERVKKYVPQANEQNFDRLAAQLARMT